MLAGWITEKVAFLSPVLVYPGEDEMIAMAEGAMRILEGRGKVLTYAPP